jgi:hypothetical protein
VFGAGLRIGVFEFCSAFTRITARTLALSPSRDTLYPKVSAISLPQVALGWSSCRTGVAPLESAAFPRKSLYVNLSLISGRRIATSGARERAVKMIFGHFEEGWRRSKQASRPQ